MWIGNDGIALGHTRLSILDLTDRGHQPMFSPDNRLVIVFNGEIYNYREIKDRLISLGHTFSGSGDTEVILHAYREWGHAAFNKFIGMFALAIWDSVDKELILVRDRVGVKPLYYTWHHNRLAFASELKALRLLQDEPPLIYTSAVGEYLQYGYVAAPRSIFSHTFKLQPGHILRISVNGVISTDCYWSAPAPAYPASSEAEIEHELEELLIDAFKYRMVSDVPVGIFLSGGIDSSLVTALLGRSTTNQLKTFTIGFSEDDRDESRWARRVAQQLETDHTEAILTPDHALGIIRKWGELFDEPFGDSSGIPTFLVSRLASQHVKVVLSADGGDELFGGYKIYGRTLNRIRLARSVPAPLRHVLFRVFGASGGHRSTSHATLGSFGHQQLNRLRLLASIGRDASIGNIYDHGVSVFRPTEIEALMGGYENPRDLASDDSESVLRSLCRWDINHYLPDDILAKVDRTTMAVSIEGREPLLDHRLIEMAMRIPEKMKMGPLGDKHILKKILYKNLPRELIDRPKKGFAIPIDEWMKHELKNVVNDMLDNQRIRDAGLFDADAVEKLRKNYFSGAPYLARKIWLLVAFELWREAWL